MVVNVSGFDFWELRIDGTIDKSDRRVTKQLLQEPPSNGADRISFVFSHGWKTDKAGAAAAVRRFFTKSRTSGRRPRAVAIRGAAAGRRCAGWPRQEARRGADLIPGGGAASAAADDDGRSTAWGRVEERPGVPRSDGDRRGEERADGPREAAGHRARGRPRPGVQELVKALAGDPQTTQDAEDGPASSPCGAAV